MYAICYTCLRARIQALERTQACWSSSYALYTSRRHHGRQASYDETDNMLLPFVTATRCGRFLCMKMRYFTLSVCVSRARLASISLETAHSRQCSKLMACLHVHVHIAHDSLVLRLYYYITVRRIFHGIFAVSAVRTRRSSCVCVCVQFIQFRRENQI